MNDHPPTLVHGALSVVSRSQSLNGRTVTLAMTVKMFMLIVVSHPSVRSLGGQRER